jgi:hypothetical protein
MVVVCCSIPCHASILQALHAHPCHLLLLLLLLLLLRAVATSIAAHTILCASIPGSHPLPAAHHHAAPTIALLLLLLLIASEPHLVRAGLEACAVCCWRLAVCHTR